MSVAEWNDLIERKAQEHGVDSTLIRAVMHQESRGNPQAVSPAGARGLMQLMPSTARNLGVKDPFDPEQNVDAGVRLLKELSETYKGDKRLMLAAYNAGPEAVRKHKGVPPYKETQNYVKNIMSYIGEGPAEGEAQAKKPNFNVGAEADQAERMNPKYFSPPPLLGMKREPGRDYSFADRILSAMSPSEVYAQDIPEQAQMNPITGPIEIEKLSSSMQNMLMRTNVAEVSDLSAGTLERKDPYDTNIDAAKRAIENVNARAQDVTNYSALREQQYSAIESEKIHLPWYAELGLDVGMSAATMAAAGGALAVLGAPASVVAGGAIIGGAALYHAWDWTKEQFFDSPKRQPFAATMLDTEVPEFARPLALIGEDILFNAAGLRMAKVVGGRFIGDIASKIPKGMAKGYFGASILAAGVDEFIDEGEVSPASMTKMLAGGALVAINRKNVHLIGDLTGKALHGVSYAFKPFEHVAELTSQKVGAPLYNMVIESRFNPINWKVPGTQIGDLLGGIDQRKTLREVLQPGLERLRTSNVPEQKLAGELAIDAMANRGLGAEAGYFAESYIRDLNPLERSQFFSAISNNTKLKNPTQRLKEALDAYTTRHGEANLDSLYKGAEKDSLNRLIWKPMEEAGKELKEAGLIKGNINTGMYRFLEHTLDSFAGPMGKKGIDLSLKESRNVLKGVMTDPNVPEGMKHVVKEMLWSSASTPTLVSEASKDAAYEFLKIRLFENGILKSSDDLMKMGLKDPKSFYEAGYVKSKFAKIRAGHHDTWVPRDLELELESMSRVPQIMNTWWNRNFMSKFKAAMTVMRPGYHLVENLGNLILNDWGGLPFWRMDIYSKALKEMSERSQNWMDLRRHAGLAGGWSRTELFDFQKQLKYGANMFEKIGNAWNMASTPGSNLSVKMTNFFQFAKYLHSLEKGMSKPEAAWDAVRWTAHYGETTPFVAQASKTVMPFARWQSKIVPIMAETAAKHPIRMAKWLLMAQGIQSMAFEQVGVSPDEWSFMKSMMPEYMKDSWFLLIPWRDDRNRLNVMNMTNLIPGLQQVSDFMNKSPVDAAISSPVYSLVGAMKSKTKFNGAPLYYEWEKPSTKAAKTFGYVWESLMPSWFPGGYDWNKISDAMNDRADAPCVEEALLSAIGLRTRPVDPAQLAQRQIAIKRIHLSELQGQLRRDLRNSSSPEETQKIIARYTETRQDIQSKYSPLSQDQGFMDDVGDVFENFNPL